VTVGGYTHSANFPTTTGAYDAKHNAGADAFVSRLDPRKSGAAQLVFSTFLGGSRLDKLRDLTVDARGVVTLTGYTDSVDFPTTKGAFDTTFNSASGEDVFVSRLDPSKNGTAQLAYSSFLGGSSAEYVKALSVDAGGVATVVGWTRSLDFPTTRGAYNTTKVALHRAFVSRLDPRQSGTSQLAYSTFLSSGTWDVADAVSVDTSGVMTVAGYTYSSNFPTTVGAFDRSLNGLSDVFVCRLDPKKNGALQLVYSTLIGGKSHDVADAVSVSANGVVTVAGQTQSADYPTTRGTFDSTYNGPTTATDRGDAFVSRLDPQRTGAAQLVYSTYLGGGGVDLANALSVDADGVVTVAGWSGSANFPTTRGAHDTTNNFWDGFVTRLDPRRSGGGQLVYGTYLGGKGYDVAQSLSVDASGTATVGGWTVSGDFPTTRGAYATTHGGVVASDVFVSRLDMGVAMWADVHALSVARAGRQNLTLSAGKVHANRFYAVVGSLSGTRPGIAVNGFHLPLNLDAYTEITIFSGRPPIWNGFLGVLDGEGAASASFQLPPGLPPLAGVTMHHAFLVFDQALKVHMTSNAVPVTLKN
jgi:hypothetical protein